MALCQYYILLYGSEVWCLKENLLHRLRSFHHRCVRTMCRINIAHTIRHHISSSSLFARLGIEPLDSYYQRRLLRWAGHVSRMPIGRLPRMLLTGWVANPRPIGCPQMTWGRTLKKALLCKDLPTEFAEWSKLAADRVKWHQICGGTSTQMPYNENDRRTTWAQLRNGPEKIS